MRVVDMMKDSHTLRSRRSSSFFTSCFSSFSFGVDVLISDQIEDTPSISRRGFCSNSAKACCKSAKSSESSLFSNDTSKGEICSRSMSRLRIVNSSASIFLVVAMYAAPFSMAAMAALTTSDAMPRKTRRSTHLYSLDRLSNAVRTGGYHPSLPSSSPPSFPSSPFPVLSPPSTDTTSSDGVNPSICCVMKASNRNMSLSCTSPFMRSMTSRNASAASPFLSNSPSSISSTNTSHSSNSLSSAFSLKRRGRRHSWRGSQRGPSSELWLESTPPRKKWEYSLYSCTQ
mmetsp:Transcript_28656/g.73192  ORF Transcript_28656/g.73192 Transcript_28656/m.73192 type:complete len:286 (-) Transcript_28656:1261-2118(-)